MIYKNSVIIFVFNDKGELALQLRAEKDDSYPLHWDFSAAGGIELGEDHKLAAQRELKEEIGIKSEVQFVEKELFEGKRYSGEDYISDLYLYKAISNGPLKIQVEEVEEVKFFKLEEIQKMIDAHEKFHPEFLFAWENGAVARIHKI